jgi:polyferredoxin
VSRLELTRNPSFRAALGNRYPQFLILALMLAAFLFAIAAGLLGTPVGSRNFGIVFVWIAWWAVLILVAVPLLGRGWCSICPIPLPGEWLQRGAVLGPAGAKPRGLNLRWPKPLRNIWLQSASFLLLALFSTVLLTSPTVTAIVLAGMLVAALGLSLVFERRSFCRYLCPVGGFIGLFSQAAPIELRIKDKAICAACVGKPCYNGSSAGYGCPWDVFPGGLAKNTYCGLCLECIRTCPSDNIALNLRPFAADLAKPSARLDEAFKSFVMLGSAMVYSAVLLGPWGNLKDAAYRIGSSSWFLYAAAFLAFVGILLPATFSLCALRASNRTVLRQRFSRLSTALIPLGLTAWIAFSLSFVSTNASYIVASLSDPLGLGWNLAGTATIAWQPVLSTVVAPAQTLVLVVGMVWSARTAQTAAAEAGVSSIPIIVYCLAAAAVLLWLLL